MIKYNSTTLEIKIKKCIHWYQPMSAIGKSFLPEFLRLNGIRDIKIHVIDNKKSFDNIGRYIELLDENDIIFIDRGDLYLMREDLLSLLKYERVTILIDMKMGILDQLRESGTPVELNYNGRKMVLKDVYDI